MAELNHINIKEDILKHYGVGAKDGAPGRGSGRYPLGSGEHPNQHSGDFLSRVDKLKKTGMSDTEIAKAMGLTTTQYRAQKSLATHEQREMRVATARRLRDQGLSLDAIAAEMGFKNDSSVRSLLNSDAEQRMNKAKTTADFLADMCKEKGMIDIGKGVELELGVSKEKLREAVEMLKMDGYEVYNGRMPQVTNPGKWTTLSVLCPPGTEHKEIFQYENINSVRDYDKVLLNDGESIKPSFVYPKSMDSKRLSICYAEEGGIEKDGLIELRPGVKDLSLGESTYAQVRILVDGTHYLKGMAVYNDDLPEGVDVRFNTNKTQGTEMTKVLKAIKSDPDNPFGSLIKEHGGQSYYIDDNGKEQLSLINKRAEEGDWGEWSKKLSAQMLSKQPLKTAKQQLDIEMEDKKAEFKDICELTNPTVKKALLKSFADDCDSSAVHLKAAAFPRQKYQVIIPLPSAKDTEIYAPNYNNGEQVALIRFPHGGTFEIPILTVNNKIQEGKKYLGATPKDAVGINSKVAERLSGADFDGDTVMVIPITEKSKIKSTKPLEDLKDFDPKMQYPEREGMKYMKNTQTEMGKISNLITDMTLLGAAPNELARAVKHSMVVIDAEKHKLDYKRSEVENNIAALKRKYQGTIDPETGRYHEGAGTLISRAKSQQSVIKRQGSPIINDDGTLTWKTVDEPTYVNKMGKTVTRTQRSTKMTETKDAYSLVSKARNPMEIVYADFANGMKDLANQARKTMINTGKIEYSAKAKSEYREEVSTLMAKLNVALKNSPKERKAQILANSIVQAKQQSNPDMTKAEIKKASQQALTAARNQLGAKRELIKITDNEWKAIQSGAISENVLNKIINNIDIDILREKATPRSKNELSQAKISRINSMKNLGYTTAEIAQRLGVSSSTVQKYL